MHLKVEDNDEKTLGLHSKSAWANVSSRNAERRPESSKFLKLYVSRLLIQWINLRYSVTILYVVCLLFTPLTANQDTLHVYPVT